MRFRLIYEGPLKATQRDTRAGQVDARAPHKNAIRSQFHAQLEQLWRTDRLLSQHRVFPKDYEIHRPSDGAIWGMSENQMISLLDAVKEKHQVDGRALVPLVRKQWRLDCSLEVLFLRPGSPGGLWGSAGDIDNRIKTLVDALRIPRTTAELAGLEHPPEQPFFCLLEDDDLITGLSVETDTLLRQREVKTDHDRSNVVAIVTVTVRPYDVTTFNLSFV